MRDYTTPFTHGAAASPRRRRLRQDLPRLPPDQHLDRRSRRQPASQRRQTTPPPTCEDCHNGVDAGAQADARRRPVHVVPHRHEHPAGAGHVQPVPPGQDLRHAQTASRATPLRCTTPTRSRRPAPTATATATRSTPARSRASPATRASPPSTTGSPTTTTVKNCRSCHAKRHAGKNVAQSKCATCHKGTGTGPAAKAQHSTHASPRATSCSACHSQRLHASALGSGITSCRTCHKGKFHAGQRTPPQQRVHGLPRARRPARQRVRCALCHRSAVHNAQTVHPAGSAAERMSFRLTTRGLTIAAIVLTVVVVGIGVALAATSTPQFCASCKSHVPYVDEWRASAHDGVNCEQCHSKPGPFFFLTAKLEALQQPIAQITGDYEKPILGYVLNQSCRRCHNNDLLFNPVSKNGIRVQHKHLIEAGFLCMRCHSTQAHGDGRPRGLAHLPEHGPVPDLPQQRVQGAGRPGGHLTVRSLPHRSRTTAAAPASHEEPDWPTRHGAVGILSTCSACHVKKDACSKCHSGVLHAAPAAVDLRARAHDVEARGDSEACDQCHDTKQYCKTCHQVRDAAPDGLRSQPSRGHRPARAPRPASTATCVANCQACHEQHTAGDPQAHKLLGGVHVHAAGHAGAQRRRRSQGAGESWPSASPARAASCWRAASPAAGSSACSWRSACSSWPPSSASRP